jgi:hypothetical protein
MATAAKPKQAPAKRVTQAATPAAGNAERVLMTAIEPVKYAGKRLAPGDPLAVDPDEVEGLIADGLAQIAEASEAGE